MYLYESDLNCLGEYYDDTRLKFKETSLNSHLALVTWSKFRQQFFLYLFHEKNKLYNLIGFNSFILHLECLKIKFYLIFR